MMIKTVKKIIVSASRRTDLPAFYTDWLIDRFQQGFVEVINPYNQNIYTVSLSVEHVHSVVLWSKNFLPLLKRMDELKAYQLFFMFTLNDSCILEPHVPALIDRFEQFDFILKRFGKERLLVRFDPIVHWKEGRAIKNNLASYETIIKKAADSGITKVKTSFMNTHYRKLYKRGFHFVDLDIDKKKDIAWKLGRIASNYNVMLQFCCNDFLFEDEDIPYIEKSCCIDGNYISRIVGEPTILKKDPSQRKECNCTYSRDIGNYTQRCYHSCLYCYANPSKDS